MKWLIRFLEKRHARKTRTYNTQRASAVTTRYGGDSKVAATFHPGTEPEGRI